MNAVCIHLLLYPRVLLLTAIRAKMSNYIPQFHFDGVTSTYPNTGLVYLDWVRFRGKEWNVNIVKNAVTWHFVIYLNILLFCVKLNVFIKPGQNRLIQQKWDIRLNILSEGRLSWWEIDKMHFSRSLVRIYTEAFYCDWVFHCDNNWIKKR